MLHVVIVDKVDDCFHSSKFTMLDGKGKGVFYFDTKEQLGELCKDLEIILSKVTEYKTEDSGNKEVFTGNKELTVVTIKDSKEVPKEAKKIRGAIVNCTLDFYVKSTDREITLYEPDYSHKDSGFNLSEGVDKQDSKVRFYKAYGYCSLDLCVDCNKPSKKVYSEVETPGDMFWCEGLFHEESRLIHDDCANWYNDDGDVIKCCKECYSNLQRNTDLTVDYINRPKHDSHQFDLYTKDYDMFKEDQTYHHLYASFSSEHRMRNWCELLGLNLGVYNENRLKVKDFHMVTFDDIKDVPQQALHNKCHAIDKNMDTIFYCYLLKTDYHTFIYRPINSKDMKSANSDRRQLEPFYKVPFLGKFK
ncbi:hypothetical protein P9X10_01185 [Bacillus cereus]|nr:hypothetical protein [Bacillus cereus]